MLVAVREDRSPGGKHRKRQRTEEPASQFSPLHEEHPDLNDSLIESLIAARPDSFPAYEGGKYKVVVFSRNFYEFTIQRLQDVVNFLTRASIKF